MVKQLSAACENLVVRLEHPRPLNEGERRILDLLLDADFHGAKELRFQVLHATVVERCDCGCPTVDLEVPEAIPASPVETPIRLAPVEGRVTPLGAEPIADIILFVDQGRMTCLEYVSYQDIPPSEWPSPDRCGHCLAKRPISRPAAPSSLGSALSRYRRETRGLRAMARASGTRRTGAGGHPAMLGVMGHLAGTSVSRRATGARVPPRRRRRRC